MITVAVEHEGGDGVGEGAGIDAAFVGLGPAGVVVVGIDVGEEAVLHAVGVVPCGAGLLVSEVEADDGFCGFEAVLPWHDNADGCAVLVGQGLAVAAKGKEREGVHGFVHTKAFFVGPVVAGGEVHDFLINGREELDVLGAGEGLAKVDELGERVAVPRDDHGPGFDATMTVDAGLERAVVEEVVDVDGLGLFNHACDLDGPRAGVKFASVARGVGLFRAVLVKIVVGAGFGEGRLGLVDGVAAGNGLELVGGVDTCRRVDEAGDVAGSQSADTECRGSGEEAAAVLLVLLEDVLGRDIGGTDGGFETVGLTEKHV